MCHGGGGGGGGELIPLTHGARLDATGGSILLFMPYLRSGWVEIEKFQFVEKPYS